MTDGSLSNTHQWVVIDIEKEKYKWVWAGSHREAVAKGIKKYGIVARRPGDCNARSGFMPKMDSEELQRFINKLKVDG